MTQPEMWAAVAQLTKTVPHTLIGAALVWSIARMVLNGPIERIASAVERIADSMAD